MKLSSQTITSWFLRIGLAFVFVYAAVGSLTQPLEWIGYLPSFLIDTSLASPLLVVISIGELLLAVWLLSGKFVQYAGILATIALVGIIFSQPGAFSTTFRDVGLALMALALTAHESPELKRFLDKRATN